MVSSDIGHYELVRLLLQRGAEVTNSNALWAAASRGHLEIARLLLSHGAEIDWQE